MSTEMKETKQYLTFSLDEETFAIDVIKTREILNLTTITQVPQTPEFLLGVINLRSSVVPVIDMRLKFGMPSVDQSVDSCIIVMEVEVDEESVTVGALVDSVQEVIDLDEAQIEPPPRLGTRLKTEFLKGMGNQNGNFIMILNIDKVFSSEELNLVQDLKDEAV
jgi:purine-binding chemotaxis protein CheW